jgi:predicted AAA+ superfamily ATPase
VELIYRSDLLFQVKESLRHNPIVVLQGPRQCGKTTLARQFAVPESHYFDLDDPLDQIRLEENARTTLASLSGLIVIDEVQRKPELFPLLRVMADRDDRPARFLLLGSSSTLLLEQVSETLAGRAELIDMGGLSIGEVGTEHWRDLWIKGGFPRAFQQRYDQSLKWRLNYLHQFVNRDLREIADTKMSEMQVRRLLGFLAASSGGAWNHSKAGQSIGVNYKTIQRHLEIFKAAFIIRELPVYDNNTHKRLRKAPTVYVRDSGLVHALMQIYDFGQLLAHPILGASWEGFALEQVVRFLSLSEDQLFTWSVQSGAEMDLVIMNQGRLYGVEFKNSEAPRTTRSFTLAFQELGLVAAVIVHPGPKTYELAEGRWAVSIQDLAKLEELLGSRKG